MKAEYLKIKSVGKITHDVVHFITEKPEGVTFTPGQAADISIHKPGWEDEIRPFTFTCLPENDYLEFMIKTYPSRNGVTNQLLSLKQNDELILHGVFGAIAYKGEGTFIAGGAGITPFISIFRYLKSKNEIGNNRLIFANKTKADIILEKEFQSTLGLHFINILSEEKVVGYSHGLISKEFIIENCGAMDKFFYLCGPPPMIDIIEQHLVSLHVESELIVKEAV